MVQSDGHAGLSQLKAKVSDCCLDSRIFPHFAGAVSVNSFFC